MKKVVVRSRLVTVFSMAMIGAVVSSPRVTLSDGKYFPEKAYKVAPAIPTQRVILVYQDETEKLTIESALDGEGREFGWVIPLPSRPTEFEEALPGLLKTLSLAVQPEIVHDLREEMLLFWSVAVLITLFCVLGVTVKRPYRLALLVLFVILFVPSVLLRPLHRSAGFSVSWADLPGITVHEIQEVGSYELAVLEADHADALNRWLKDSGFTELTEDDGRIVSDYIRAGWCFVAAKLRRERDGYSRPHPVSMSFATGTPVYPVRLTGTTGNEVYLEVFVIAERQATCKALTLEVADTYRLGERTISAHTQQAAQPGFVGSTYRQEIGHPGAAEHLWDGCVLTRLCGRLQPKKMNEDIIIQLVTGESYQKRYFSHRGARDRALTYGLGAWCVLLVPLTAFFRKRRRQQRRLVGFFQRAAAPALVCSLLAGAVTYALLPKVHAKPLAIGRQHLRVYYHAQRTQRFRELASLANEHDQFAGMSRDDIAKLLDDYYASEGTANPFTAEPIGHEDSPGNYTLLEDDRGIVWRTYTVEGYPDDCVLTSLPALFKKTGI